MLGIVTSYDRCPFCDADLCLDGGSDYAVEHIVDCTKREAHVRNHLELLRTLHPEVSEEENVETPPEASRQTPPEAA